MYSIIKYLLFLTTAVFVIVDGVLTYGCYRQPDSPCSHHTLTCKDGEVIAIEDTSNYGNIAYVRKKPGYTCHQDQMEICNATCCRYQGRNEDINGFIPVNQSDRLSVYRNCSNQPTCTVISPYSPDTDYHYIRYPYICVPDNQDYNMMEITDVSFEYNGYLYYSGKTQTSSTTITRCCNITSSKNTTINSFYIYLTEESSYNVKIYSENQTLLRGVDEGGLLYGYEELSISGNTIYHLVLDNLTVEEDDYIWIFIKSNSSITISCGDSFASDSITNCGDSTSPGTFPDSSEELGLIIGCVVGIVVVVLVVVVVVCCIIRRRRKSKSDDNHQEIEYTSNNNGGESEYDTIQDGDTKKRDSSYHAIDDHYLQDATNDKKAAGGPSSNTSPRDEVTYQVIDHDITNKSPNIATPKDDFGIKSAAQPNTTLSKDETDYQDNDNNFSTKPVCNLPNKTSSKYEAKEAHYHVIDGDCGFKPKAETGYSEPWETCIKLEPRCDLRSQPLDSKFQYSVVTPRNARRQGEGNPSKYDHISTKKTADIMGQVPSYDHFKHNPVTPVVKDKTYYDHIPKGNAHPLSDPYTDPTYNHLGDKSPTRIPQQENNVSSNSTSNSLCQTGRSIDDPYNDPTYNHLGDKSLTSNPKQEKAVSPNSTSNNQCQAERNADGPNNEPTYNHLGTNDHTPAIDPTYNHLGTNDHTPAGDPIYNHLRTNDHTAAGDPTYNHLGTNDHTAAGDPTYNHLGTNDHTPAGERRQSESNL